MGTCFRNMSRIMICVLRIVLDVGMNVNLINIIVV